MTTSPTRPSTLDIHRLLDEAFAGIEMTPQAQDLKEEMRSDLVVRVAELEREGLSAHAAARRAVADLGDISSIVDEMRSVPGADAPWARMRVRPKPAYVLRTVVVALVAAVALLIVVLGAAFLDIPLAGMGASIGVLALLAGALVADALGQETTTNYPLPRRRAIGYGVATILAVAGAGTAALYLPDRQLAWLVGGAVPIVIAIAAFTYLGATQTNRHKPWVVRMQAEHEHAADRFSQDPAAAARFGVYTVAIWIVTLTAFVALSLTIGWAWSWIALIAGMVAFLITLARMLFVPQSAN